MRDQREFMQRQFFQGLYSQPPRPFSELFQAVCLHEVLHLFGFEDNPSDGLIMTGDYYTQGTPNDWKTFSPEQIRKIQAKNNPQ